MNGMKSGCSAIMRREQCWDAVTRPPRSCALAAQAQYYPWYRTRTVILTFSILEMTPRPDELGEENPFLSMAVSGDKQGGKEERPKDEREQILEAIGS